MEVELTALQRRGCVGVGLAQSTVVQGALEHLVHEGRQPVIRRGAKDSVTDNGIALTPKSLTDTVNRPAKTLDDWFTSFFLMHNFKRGCHRILPPVPGKLLFAGHRRPKGHPHPVTDIGWLSCRCVA